MTVHPAVRGIDEVIGAPDALEDLLRSQSRRLFALASFIVGDAAEAEEAVQEAAIRAWRAWGKTPLENPTAWITRICVNQSLTRREGLWRRRGTISELRPDHPAEDRPAGSDPELEAAVLRLSRQQRAVVYLHYELGHSLDDCARLMGCRPGTARSHLHRALSALREVLSDAR